MKKIAMIVLCVLMYSISIAQQQQITNEIEDYLDRANNLDRFSGVVIVQRRGNQIFKKAYGLAQLEGSVKNTVQTKFNIGSITKQFTATAILKLYQEGKLELHKPINTYLGEFASDRWKDVTVHHLLSHQSGIPSILQSGQGLDHYWPKETAISVAEQMTYFKDLKLIDSPGEEYMYNNTGYLILALIIEKVSGKSYERFMEEDIFKPNGLHATTVSKKGQLLADNHYCYELSDMEKAPEYHYSWYRGAGGNWASAEDLNTWFDVIHNGNFLSNSNKEKLFRIHAKNYGYGWVIEKRNNQKIIHHDGTDFGSTAFFLSVPKEDLRIIVLTNQTHKELSMLGKSERWIRRIGYDLLDVVNGKKVDKLPKITNNNQSYNSFIGTYSFKDGTSFSLQEKNDVILLYQEKSSVPLYRYKFHKSVILNESEIAEKSIKASEALLKKKFWGFAKYCDWEMKTVSYIGLLSKGFNQITKPLGKLEKAVVFDIKSNGSKARFYGENGSVDFDIIFNQDYKIQGLFDTGYNDNLKPSTIKLKSIVNNKLFVDGFAKGEIDATIELVNDNQQIRMIQGGRTFYANKIN